MGLFDDGNEAKRKQNLRDMEDKRCRFAQRMKEEGFAPDRMMMFSTEEGGLIGLSRIGGVLHVVVGPAFGGEGEFVLEKYENPVFHTEEHLQPAEGLGGIFGFGKKGSVGYYLILERPEPQEPLRIPVIANKNQALVCGAKNPLLELKRRRGDANVVWDMRPIDRSMLGKLQKELEALM